MKKTTRTSLFIVSFSILALLAVFFYERDAITTDASLRELVQKQFIVDQHHLDLRNRGYTQIPDICRVVSGQQADDIWSVDLGSNQITAISADLSCLKNLSELNLGFNKIRKMENLSQLTWLNKLDIGNNELTRIEDIETLERLQNLHLGYNQLTSTAGLERLTNLASLQLQRNKLTDISHLAQLTNLETLKLEFNQLTDEDLAFIPSLSKLRIITVAENQVDPAKVAEWNAKSLENMNQ